MKRPFFILFLFCVTFALKAQVAYAQTSEAAVILAYHQISDSDQGYVLSTEDFDSHLNVIKSGSIKVVPIYKAFKESTTDTLPLILTFEGAYRSTYYNALKNLVEDEIPFTLLFSPRRVNSQSKKHLSWNQINALKEHKFITLGLLPNSYHDIVGLNDAQLSAVLNKDIKLFQSKLGTRPQYISLPHGTYSAENLETLKRYNFKGVLGLHSGVAYKDDISHVLPRFSLTNGYGSLDRFLMISGAQPFHFKNITPKDPFLKAGEDIAIGFNVDIKENEKALYCFASDIGRLDLQEIGNNRYEIRLDKEVIPPGRLRINCTQNCDISLNDRHCTRWRGMMFTVAE